MYLPNSNCFRLDEVIKSFEVALRSLVAERLTIRYSEKTSFKEGLENDIEGIETLIKSSRYQDRVMKLKNNYKTVYKELQYSCASLHNQDYDQRKVVFVGELIDLLLFFFSKNFIDLSKNFRTVDDFFYLASKYQRIRNDLSHPASCKISLDECRDIVTFIRKLLDNLDDQFFWFVNKSSIRQQIDNLVNEVFSLPVRIQNLTEISFHHQRLLFRDEQIRQLKEYILGDGEFYRQSSSVVVFGYGGVGKTALVLEFLNELIKDLTDRNEFHKYDFLLFFTSKEEILDYSRRTGEIYINEIRKQVNSYNEFITNLYDYLGITDYSDLRELQKFKGIVVVDNLETLQEEKEKILHFIKHKCPRSIQFIITSRNEEKYCEDKLYVSEFDETNNGIEFIEHYISNNELQISLNGEQKKSLLTESKGNTLVLILSLLRLNEGNILIQELLHELSSGASRNSEIIADFMFKNTLNQTIYALESKGFKPTELLTVVSLYQEPIDIYSISVLAEIKTNDAETICNLFVSKLVLNKESDSFTLNEFANRFIIIKFMPDEIQRRNFQNRIIEHKDKINRSVDNLNRLKSKSVLLNRIMEDWKPRNKIDEISISETFDLFSEAKKLLNKKGSNAQEISKGFERINSSFENHELTTRHPYILCQKARVFQLLLDANIDPEETIKIINDYYERMIYSVEFEYTYIKKTYSYASILWIYGIFLNRKAANFTKSIKYLEDAKNIFESLNIIDFNYKKLLNELSVAYRNRYNETNIDEYLHRGKDYLVQRDSLPYFSK